MPGRTVRKFTLADAMVLVAATAVGAAFIRGAGTDLVNNLSRTHPALMLLGTAVLRAVEFSPVPACLAVALWLLGLKDSAGGRRRLARCPGHVACGAVLVAAILGLVGLAPVTAGLGLVKSRERMFETIELMLCVGTGVGVATGWLVLAGAGLWRPGSHWIDRAGRVLGGFWIAMTVALNFLIVTEML